MTLLDRFVSAACIVLAGIALSGCDNSGEFPTAPVSGRVLCEGKPVPHVMVFFEPLESGKSSLVGRAGHAIANEDGIFVLSSYRPGEGDGAVIGKHRVRVGPPHPEDHPNYKCDCYLNDEVDLMEVEVKKGKNKFDLVLKKRTGREPPPRKND
jgi:hypothetical protein